MLGGLGPFVTGQIVAASGSFKIPIYLVTGLLVLSVVIAALARPPHHALRSAIEVDPGAHKDYPERLLPSEYVRRQIYGMYWFENKALRAVIDQLADNLMFETDFPHATSLSPGPASESPSPREIMERSLGGLPDDTVGKVLQHTATKLYHLPAPAKN